MEQSSPVSLAYSKGIERPYSAKRFTFLNASLKPSLLSFLPGALPNVAFFPSMEGVEPGLLDKAGSHAKGKNSNNGQLNRQLNDTKHH